MNSFGLSIPLPLTEPQINPHVLCALDGMAITAQIVPLGK